MRIVGMMVVGAGEADRWLMPALTDISWCDKIYVCLNNQDQKTEDVCRKLGCELYWDHREWGKEQWKIKQDFFNYIVKDSNPDWIVAKDADEVFGRNFKRKQAEELVKQGGPGYNFYVVNLYDDGWCQDFSFWNVRFFEYNPNYDNRWQQRNLHCGLYPLEIHRYANFAPYILKHYGLKKKEDRAKKVKRYEKYDPNNRWMRMNTQYYDFLRSQLKAKPFDEDELQEKVKIFAQQQYHKKIKEKPMDNKKYHYFRRVIDGELIPVEENLVEIQKQMKGKDGNPAFIYVEEVKDVNREVVPEIKQDPLVCEICGFKAKNSNGLRMNNKKHE